MKNKFNEVKLVVSDMDGTLLDNEHRVPSRFWSLFRQLRKKGIQFVAASGRQYYNLLKLFPEIKDDMYFISDNGSYAAYQGQDLVVQGIERQQMLDNIRIAKKIDGTYPILCGKKSAYLEPEAVEKLETIGMYYEECQVVNNFEEVQNDDYLKLAIMDTINSSTNSYPHFRHLHEIYQVKISGEGWLDVSHLKANKGEALKHIQNELDITPEETMVFGDFLNDLELMDQAEFSYAMTNAHPDLKAKANYITHDVVEVLEWVVN